MDEFPEKIYPQVFERVKASFIDTLVMIGLGILFTTLFEKIGNVPDNMRIAALVSLLLYDPLFTTFFGGTIGHYLNGIRIKQITNESKNIPFLFACVRYALKLSLGTISLLTIGSNQKRLAIHDMIIHSVVLYAK